MQRIATIAKINTIAKFSTRARSPANQLAGYHGSVRLCGRETNLAVRDVRAGGRR